RITHLAGERGGARVPFECPGVAADLAEAPAERVQQPALPRPVADALADLGRLGNLGDRATVLPEAAVRLAEKPARPHDEVGQLEPPAGRDDLLADRDRARVVAAPFRLLRHREADQRVDGLDARARRHLRGALVRGLLGLHVALTDAAHEPD